MGYLADVNFLIALLHAKHALSERAVAWLGRQEQAGSILLCRVAQMGVLRILTNPTWLKGEVLSAAAVWDAWDLLLTDDRFASIQEPAGIESEWRLVTRDFAAGRPAGTDAYLAAFARAGGYSLLTFDRGFHQFEDLAVEIPD
ncbi:MAG TPA: TA system VapC family ribonuclease toxin [Thermoanaerobaculia bacterium]|nr:TA system VapC family ribonuclease toxin [Thermoanaerobaculia bacterium]